MSPANVVLENSRKFMDLFMTEKVRDVSLLPTNKIRARILIIYLCAQVINQFKRAR